MTTLSVEVDLVADVMGDNAPSSQSSQKPGIMGTRRSDRTRKREEDGEGGGGHNNNSTNNGNNKSHKGENDSQGSGPSTSKRSKSSTGNDGDNRGGGRTRPPERWRAQKMAEDYVNLVGDLMYPKVSYGPYGYDRSQGEIPLERPNTLGVLLCPARRPTVMEQWSPFEVACFEGAISLVGKNFYEIAKCLKNKNTKDVIEFYYVWKMTSHYQQWKRGFEPMDPHPFALSPPDE